MMRPGAMNCGPPRVCFGSIRRGDEAEADADTFPVLAHHLPLKIYISVTSLSACQDLQFRNVPVRLSRSAFPCEARAADDTAHTLEKIGIMVNGNGERKVLFPLFVEGVDVVS